MNSRRNDPDDETQYATDREVKLAKFFHAWEEVQIDTPAKVSRGEDGVWVQAWVFVSHRQLRQ